MKLTNHISCTLVLAALLAFSPGAAAQGGKHISGTVTDKDNIPVIDIR